MNLIKLDTNPYQNLWGHSAFWLFDVTILFYATSMYFIRRVILSWIKSKIQKFLKHQMKDNGRFTYWQ